MILAWIARIATGLGLIWLAWIYWKKFKHYWWHFWSGRRMWDDLYPENRKLTWRSARRAAWAALGEVFVVFGMYIVIFHAFR